jgi:hypothetical protein
VRDLLKAELRLSPAFSPSSPGSQKPGLRPLADQLAFHLRQRGDIEVGAQNH